MKPVGQPTGPATDRVAAGANPLDRYVRLPPATVVLWFGPCVRPEGRPRMNTRTKGDEEKMSRVEVGANR